MHSNGKHIVLAALMLSSIVSCQKEDLANLASREAVPILEATTASTKLIYEETFEGLNPFGTYVTKQIGTTYGFTLATAPVFEGAKSGRFELRDTDPITSGGTRSEVKFPMLENPDRWYSFSVFFPAADYLYDSKAEIISQWHQSSGYSPSISLITRYDKLVIEKRSVPEIKTQYALGDVVKDTWQTYVLHIIHSNGADGLIEIWRDGSKIFTLNAPNSYDYTLYEKPKWKVGLYKWDWNGTETTDTDKRVIYFDNVRLGNETASYNDMITPEAIIEPILTPVLPSMTINNFTIVNASTDRDVVTITEGGSYSIRKLKLSKMNIRANPSFSSGSIKFELTGPQTMVATDDVLPYALMGDNSAGDYYFGIWGPPKAGTYTLKATPYQSAGATGTMGTASTIRFTITN